MESGEELGKKTIAGHSEPDSGLSILKDQQRRNHAHKRANNDHGLEYMVCAKLFKGKDYGCFTGLAGCAERAVGHHAKQHNRHSNIENCTNNQGSNDAKGNISLWIAGLFRGRGYRIKTDVSKENNRSARHDSWKTGGRKGVPIDRPHKHGTYCEKQKDGGYLDYHHYIVCQGTLAHATNQQDGQYKDDQKCGEIEIRATPSVRRPHRR